MKRRVVITGLGAVTPVGIGVKPFWQALRQGVPGIGPVTLFDPSAFPCKVAAEVRGFEPHDFMDARTAAGSTRFVQFGVAAARMAVEDAGLAGSPRAARFSVCFGCSANAGMELQESFSRFLNGRRRFLPSAMLESAGHAISTHVASELGLAGQTMSLTTGCLTGIDVVQWGCQQIQNGLVSGVVAGAAEAPLFDYVFAAWCGLGVLTHWAGPPAQALRPFDALSDGVVLGEGAGAFVLEDRDHARARGARVYGEVLGYGSGSEDGAPGVAEHSGSGFQAAVREALQAARLGPGDIDAISAHASGSPEHDRAETAAYKAVFGARAYGIPVSSIKPMSGQSMGAAGATQVVAGCFTLEEQFVPPTLNHDVPAPFCDLDYVPNRGRVARVNRLLVAARALGGTRSALILGRPAA